jgi:hypothetical protein
MNYCPECGERVDEHDTFCANCGTKLRQKPRSGNSEQEQSNRSDQSSTEGGTEATIFQVLGGVSAGAVVAGTFLNWVEFEFVSILDNSIVTTVAGTDYNLGIAILLLAAASFVCFLPQEPASHLFGGLFGLAIFVGMVAFVNDPLLFTNLDDFEAAALSEVSEIGIGAYVSLAGGIGIAIFGLFSAAAVSK